jgi:hypothetical protein
MPGARSQSQADYSPSSPYSPTYLRGLSADELRDDDRALVAARDCLVAGTLCIDEIAAEGTVETWLRSYLDGCEPPAPPVVTGLRSYYSGFDPLERGREIEAQAMQRIAEGGDDGSGIHTPESAEYARAKRKLDEQGVTGDAAIRELEAALGRFAQLTRRKTREDRAAREYWGVKPKRPKQVRQRRAPLAIERRRVHRERRPAGVRVARRRSTSASRDGPDDLDPPPSPAAAIAARVIAAAGIHHTFAELRFLLAPLLSPAEALQVSSLLPSEAEEEAWAQ